MNDYRAAGGALLRRDHAPADAAAARRTSGPATASTTCRTGRRTHRLNLDSAEYANDDLPLHDLVRAGVAGRHGAVRRRADQAAAGLGRAHRLRLLDARRLPELGHRLQLQALARGPHLGARAAGPARDRVVAALSQRARDRAVGQVHVRRGFRLLRAPGARCARRRTASPPAILYHIKVDPLGPSVRELFAARMQADAARAVALGLGELPAARAAAALLLRRRHRPARGHHSRATRPRSCRSTSTRFRTAGSSWRACTTATSGSSRTSAAGRGRASAWWCATPRQGRCCSRSAPASARPLRPPLEMLALAAGSGAPRAAYP